VSRHVYEEAEAECSGKTERIGFNFSTLNVFIGRANPLRFNSPMNSVSPCASAALWTLRSIKIYGSSALPSWPVDWLGVQLPAQARLFRLRSGGDRSFPPKCRCRRPVAIAQSCSSSTLQTFHESTSTTHGGWLGSAARDHSLRHSLASSWKLTTFAGRSITSAISLDPSTCPVFG
jgi:hypothetical protein